MSLCLRSKFLKSVLPGVEDDCKLALCNVWVAEKGSGERAVKDVYLLAAVIDTLDLDNFCCHSTFPSQKFTRLGVSKHILFSYLPVSHGDM